MFTNTTAVSGCGMREIPGHRVLAELLRCHFFSSLFLHRFLLRFHAQLAILAKVSRQANENKVRGNPKVKKLRAKKGSFVRWLDSSLQ